MTKAATRARSSAWVIARCVTRRRALVTTSACAAAKSERRFGLVRRVVALLVVLVAISSPPRARADERLEIPEADFRHVADYAWFALGAASAFVGHELGHVVT